jgi:hypothetical protein
MVRTLLRNEELAMNVTHNLTAYDAHHNLESNSAPKPLDLPRLKNDVKIFGISNQPPLSAAQVNLASANSSNGAQASTIVTISDQARQALANQM